jgi:methyl-accepting chemotaxis protein
MIENISAVTEETAASAEEISSITQEQTASLQQINAGSHALTQIAEVLKKQVTVFKV